MLLTVGGSPVFQPVKGGLILAVDFLHSGDIAANVGVMDTGQTAVFALEFVQGAAVLEKVFHIVILSGPVGACQNLIFRDAHGILKPPPSGGPEGGKLTAGTAGGGEASAYRVRVWGRRFLLFRRGRGAGDVLDTLQHLLRREALRL